MLPSAQDASVCSLCNGTGWKSFQDGEVERVTRCDCWRDDITKRLITEARIPRRYHHCTLNDFVTYDNDTLDDALSRSRQMADEFPVVERGLFFLGDPGVGKTHLACRHSQAGDSHARRAGHLLRHARPSQGDPQHVQRRDQNDGARRAPAGDGSRPSRAGRSGRGKDVGMGRRNAEPHRQHPLQRAARDDLHVELSRRAARTRTRTSSRCTIASGSACALACTKCAIFSTSRARTTACCSRTRVCRR